MKFFTKQESIVVSLILTFIVSLTLLNLRISLRRARDVQRRVDLGTLYNALNDYQRDFGFYPPSNDDGRIVACKADNFDEVVEKLKNSSELDLDLYFTGLRPCDWGKDSFSDILGENQDDYISLLPRDPQATKGFRYYYISNLRRFQVYAYLEGETTEVGYSSDIVIRNIDCGSSVCNFGRASGSTALDKSLQEYENELIEKGKEPNAI
jgi:type II secretory pathway pseudopilin PulG